MAEFLTPKPPRKKLSRHMSTGGEDDPTGGGNDSDLGQSQRSDRSSGRHVFPVIKLLKDRFPISSLHRSIGARGDHLQKLYLKRRLQGAILKQTLTAASADHPNLRPSPSDTQLSDSDDFINEMKEMVNEDDDEEDDNMKQLSSNIQAMFELLKDYHLDLEGSVKDEPLEVRLDDITYTVWVDPNSTKVETVFNTSCLYPIYKCYKRYVRGERAARKKWEPTNVLDRVTLALKPGKMYLLLGPPGAGKTTLLRAVAARLRPKKYETFSGKITYNGRELKDADGLHIENAFGYIDQLDKHAARLTVEETFEFAYQCKTGGRFTRDFHNASKEAQEVLKRADKDLLSTRLVLCGLGLTEVKDTFVGDTNVRGVSGGQRRRVTVGEMFMSRSPVLCCDEISTGLDAASTYDMIQLISYFGRLRKFTRVISLLQASPATVSLFDEVILMGEGQVLYCGPITEVENYFAGLGYIAPDFMDCADFLELISTDEGASLYDPSEEMKGERPNAPTVSELADIFRQSRLGRQIVETVRSPPTYVWSDGDSPEGTSPIVSNVAEMRAVKEKYANNFFRSTRLILKRFLVLWIRDRRLITAGAVKNILMGVSVGGVFFNTTDPVSIEGALFQAGLFVMLGAMQSSGGLIEDRVIFYKHTDANFYSVWPFVFGRSIAQIPQTILDTLMFGVILYYEVGLAGRASFSNLLIYLALLFVFALLMSQQLSMFASFSTASTNQAWSACIILMMMLFCGFIVAPDVIPNYFTWIYWWNPFAWVYRSLIVLEFRSARWDDPDQVLIELGFVTPEGDAFSSSWIRYSFYYMIPYYLACTVLTALGLSHVRVGDTSGGPDRSMPRKAPVETSEPEVNIPFKPVTLSFHDICYEVKASTRSDKLSLLKSVNGIFREGRMCALMGTSGAGKTTLMDVIAIRKRSGTITGDILLNGFPQEPISFRRCSGYVEQFDVQTPQLTVKETILFSAKLRLDARDLGETLIGAFVDKIMEDVELSNMASALVGTDESGGLSFEEKKRLSIAVELAASPSIIFLDEPTSGLDARSALVIVKTLRKIADSGRTICATIHQPSSTVFSMFDDLLLLKRGGQVVYHGELGESCNSLVSYFESKGAPMIEIGENPANWMLRVMSLEKMGDLAETFSKSTEFRQLKEELDWIKANPVPDRELEYDTKYPVSATARQDAVNQRLRTIYWRSPTYNLTRICVSGLIAFILGSVFIVDWNPSSFTETQMRARLSVIFLTFIIVGIMAIISVIPVMTMIRDMYYRHHDAGMYGSLAMGAALGVAEKWFLVLSSAIFTFIFLSTSHVNAAQFSFGFWGFFTFNLAIYSYMGQAFVCLVQSKQTAFVLASVFIGLNNFFSGLIVRPQEMIGTFFALPYAITPGRYVYEGLVVSVYKPINAIVYADPDSAYFNYLVSIGKCVANQTAECEGTTGDYIDYFFGGEFTDEHIIRNGLILGGILVLSRFVTWWALEYIRFA